MSSLYAVTGIVVAAVASLNFLAALVQLPLAAIVRQLLVTYSAIVHGALDWLLFPIGLRLPGPVIDMLFLYTLIGGCFARARAGEIVHRGGTSRPKSAPVLLRLLIWPERSHGLIVVPGEPGLSVNPSRIAAVYRHAPGWLRRTLDLVLWPRVARQYWARPRVYQNDHMGTFPSFEVGYTPSSNKFFIYDRRYIFMAQVAGVLAVVAAILVVNGFLVVPER